MLTVFVSAAAAGSFDFAYPPRMQSPEAAAEGSPLSLLDGLDPDSWFDGPRDFNVDDDSLPFGELEASLFALDPPQTSVPHRPGELVVWSGGKLGEVWRVERPAVERAGGVLYEPADAIAIAPLNVRRAVAVVVRAREVRAATESEVAAGLVRAGAHMLWYWRELSRMHEREASIVTLQERTARKLDKATRARALDAHYIELLETRLRANRIAVPRRPVEVSYDAAVPPTRKRTSAIAAMIVPATPPLPEQPTK